MLDTSSKIVFRSYHHSSSFKMAALFTLLLGLSALLLGYFLYDFGKQNFLRETEAAIDNEIALILAVTEHQTLDARRRYIDQKSNSSVHPLYLYRDAAGKWLAGNLDAVPKKVAVLREGVLQFALHQHESPLTVAAKIHTFDDGSRLLVGRDIGDITQSYERLKFFSVLIMGFMLAVVLVSFLISSFVVSRINLIAQTASRIMRTGDLSQRISIHSRWDDLSNLAQILNDLLARIEQLMQDICDVSDNIAHDLRTPLTRLRAHLEAAQKEIPDVQTMEQLVGEVDGLLSTFNALLRIANIEKSKRHQSFADVSLNQLLEDVLALYEPLAEEKEVVFHAELQPVMIEGDRDLLFQLFANVLDNAIKFSPEKSTIKVELSYEKSCPMVVVADQGEGVAPEEYERIFSRFYRTDKSRHKTGCGLGLSLVKAVAELHNAKLMLDDNKPGLKITVRF